MLIEEEKSLAPQHSHIAFETNRFNSLIKFKLKNYGKIGSDVLT